MCLCMTFPCGKVSEPCNPVTGSNMAFGEELKQTTLHPFSRPRSRGPPPPVMSVPVSTAELSPQGAEMDKLVLAGLYLSELLTLLCPQEEFGEWTDRALGVWGSWAGRGDVRDAVVWG